MRCCAGTPVILRRAPTACVCLRHPPLFLTGTALDHMSLLPSPRDEPDTKGRPRSWSGHSLPVMRQARDGALDWRFCRRPRIYRRSSRAEIRVVAARRGGNRRRDRRHGARPDFSGSAGASRSLTLGASAFAPVVPRTILSPSADNSAAGKSPVCRFGPGHGRSSARGRRHWHKSRRRARPARPRQSPAAASGFCS